MQRDQIDRAGLINVGGIEDIYEQYQKNPASVPGSWAAYFASVDSAEGQINHSPRTPAAAPSPALTQDHRVFNLILAYRAYGHLRAKVNPIATHTPSFPYELDLSRFGFKERDLGIEVPTGGLLPGLTAPLKDIIAVLEETYCGRIGLEYMDLQNPDMETWLQQEIEPKRFRPRLTIDQKKMILNHLNKSELFESFLHTKYTGQKRFSLEGGETLIPILGAILETGSELGLSEFYIGMAHRGRLNVLSNILNKSYGDIFSEFEEGYIPDSFEGSGDVKYHKGFKSQRTLESGREISVHLAANPSHLEAVNPLVQGQVRARQILMGDERTQQKAIPILIHGDAAVAGQGIVYETLQLCHLPGYSVGGTIHVVVNNQIGFTTLPKDARSTRYCTDIAKSFGAPVFHVNAEDPEGCVYATNLALELRQRFHTDVFIELNCWRKYGHNESDEPAYTQPLEYQLINSKRPVRELYRDDLIHQGVVERQVAEQLEEEFKASLQAALDTERGSPSQKNGNGKEGASNGKNRDLLFQPVATAVPLQTLKEICARFSTVPEGFTINRKLKRIVEQRVEMLEGDAGKASIDWGMGEHLAMASLLWDGTHVRLSGQDSRRGTFSQRHAMWVDQKLERKYFPLSHLKEDQGRFDVFNSPLSEYAVMGFDMGYSLANPEALVMWEAQFGDFCNGAQIMIDQFLATSEQKWGRGAGLVLLLPHGYEGQGPEHSSARIERFLQLCGDDNMQVVYPSTPAQLFHLLRRQIKRKVAKPLIVFTPKGLLRHPACISAPNDFATGAFGEILDDPQAPKKAKRLILCSGRVYYDAIDERDQRKAKDVAIVRVEQLYPMHTALLDKIFDRYKGIEDCVWLQEEPKNMGAWYFVRPFLQQRFDGNGVKVRYAGRPRSASPAAGSYALHKKQYAALMDAAFNAREEQPEEHP